MNNETIVRLKITGVIRTPEEISEIVGLTPDKAWHIGDIRPKTKVEEKYHAWMIHSGLPKSATLKAHVDALLSVLRPKTKAIHVLTRECTVEFSVVIYASESPALCFDSRVIGLIAELGASFDIDLYHMTEGL